MIVWVGNLNLKDKDHKDNKYPKPNPKPNPKVNKCHKDNPRDHKVDHKDNPRDHKDDHKDGKEHKDNVQKDQI